MSDILTLKQKGEKISVLTAYDYTGSRICDQAGVEIILVGDSAAMVMLGYSTTIPIEINDMLLFCKAVARGSKSALIVGDMPFGSYQSGTVDAVNNAIRFIKAGCDAVKIEGGVEISSTVKSLTDAGIPVMGHIGLKPQTTVLSEGYRVQGRTSKAAMKLISDAQALEQAGAFSLVLEMITSEVARIITNKISIPTIGIGSGSFCDGQVMVFHDMLGLYSDFKPKFVKQYANLAELILAAILNYNKDVKEGNFPDNSNSSFMIGSEYELLIKSLEDKD